MLLIYSIIVICRATTNLTIAIDIANSDSVSFVGNLEKHFDSFAEKGLSLQISYHILPCYTCASRHSYLKNEKNCFGGGRYCCIITQYIEYSPLVDGQLLLTEIIRQLCIYQEDVRLYLAYMNMFARDCLDNQHYTFCSSNIVSKLKLDHDFEQCIADSFEGEGDKNLKLNKILQEEIDKANNSSKLAVYLDNVDVTKQALNFVKLLCQKFKSDAPLYCDVLLEVESNSQMHLQDEIMSYCFLIFVFSLLFIALGCLKNLKNDGKKQISMFSEEKMHIIGEDQVI